jgi:hypothetical protein
MNCRRPPLSRKKPVGLGANRVRTVIGVESWETKWLRSVPEHPYPTPADGHGSTVDVCFKHFAMSYFRASLGRLAQR